MDFFQSQRLAVCYLTFFHFPERSIALVNDWLVHKGLKLIKPAHANKVLLKVARILIYIDGLLSVAQTVPKPLLSYLLPFSNVQLH
jgi:hypothetical protein